MLQELRDGTMISLESVQIEIPTARATTFRLVTLFKSGPKTTYHTAEFGAMEEAMERVRLDRMVDDFISYDLYVECPIVIDGK